VILCDPFGLAITPWWDIPIKVVEEEKEYEAIQIINVAEHQPRFVLVILYNDTGIYMSQRIAAHKPMYLKYQVPCGKLEPEETSRQAAHRKVYEETGLNIPHKRIKFFVNDPEFDCDIYYIKLNYLELPTRTEPENMGSWLLYYWISWYKITAEGRITPSLTTFRDLIWDEVRDLY